MLRRSMKLIFDKYHGFPRRRPRAIGQEQYERELYAVDTLILFVMLAMMVLFLVSCSTIKLETSMDMPDIYQAVQDYDNSLGALQQQQDNEPVISAQKIRSMNLVLLADFIQETTGQTLIINSDIASKTLDVTISDMPLSKFLSMVARMLNTEYLQVDGVHYLGQLRKDDQFSLVYDMDYYDPQELKALVESMASSDARIYVDQSSNLVITDAKDAVDRILSVLKQIKMIRQDLWVVQVIVESVNKSQDKEQGIYSEFDLSSALVLNDLSNVLTSNIDLGRVIQGRVNVISRYLNALSVADTHLNTIFVMTDSRPVQYDDSRRVPLRLRSVSPEGTVQTTGYQFINVGRILRLNLTELSTSEAMVNLDLEISEIVGQVEEAPITNQLKYSSVVPIAATGLYLVGYVRQVNSRESTRGIGNYLAVSKAGSDARIWLRVRKIQTGTKKGAGNVPLPGSSSTIMQGGSIGSEPDQDFPGEAAPGKDLQRLEDLQKQNEVLRQEQKEWVKRYLRVAADGQ